MAHHGSLTHELAFPPAGSNINEQRKLVLAPSASRWHDKQLPFLRVKT